MGPEQTCLHETDKGCVRVCLGKGRELVNTKGAAKGVMEDMAGKGGLSLLVEVVSHALVCHMLTRRTLVTNYWCRARSMASVLWTVEPTKGQRGGRRMARWQQHTGV